MNHQITRQQIEDWSSAYHQDKVRQLATLALSKSSLKDVAWSQTAANAMHQHFSVEVPTMSVTNQKHSGRCWLFAAANVLREKIAHDLNTEYFELSQSYLAFWDKFERANYFLESIEQTADLPADDRTVSFVLQTGVHDGGQWQMFANIVEKYGIVPKDAYDETYQSENTREMNYVINRALKKAASVLRCLAREGKSTAAYKTEVLKNIYGFLCACYGEPPKTFDLEYTDREKAFHAIRGLTPVAFAENHVMDLVRGAVSVIHAPTDDKPYHRTYTISMLGNVVGGSQVKHLNLTMEEMKAAIISQLQDGRIVWFGSDVGHEGERTLGIWDDACFRMNLLTGLDMTISKKDALDYGLAAMNHAMCITGVNLVDGKPNRWKIENSWGDENGKKGYYVCSDTWFDQYVFQAAIDRTYLGELADLYAQEPIVLNPWDPMGTLAD